MKQVLRVRFSQLILAQEEYPSGALPKPRKGQRLRDAQDFSTASSSCLFLLVLQPGNQTAKTTETRG